MTMENWQPLKRSPDPLESVVQMDEMLGEVIRPFDYKTDGRSTFYPYEVPKELPYEYNIGVIVGASGTGKSTLLKSGDLPSAL